MLAETLVAGGVTAEVPTMLTERGAPTLLPSTVAPSRNTLMLAPTTCTRSIVRTWPSASCTEAPALNAAWLAALDGIEKPADLRHTPFSQSVLVKALMLAVAADAAVALAATASGAVATVKPPISAASAIEVTSALRAPAKTLVDIPSLRNFILLKARAFKKVAGGQLSRGALLWKEAAVTQPNEPFSKKSPRRPPPEQPVNLLRGGFIIGSKK